MHHLFAQVVLWAAETAEEPSGIDLILPATEELIAGIIAFAIVFVGFWFLVRPKMSEMLAARQQAIAGQLAHAEEAKSEAESLLEDYRTQLAQARQEANEIVEQARQQAEAVRADVLAKADAEAAERRRRAEEEIAAERERLASSLQTAFTEFSLDVAQKAVKGTVDAEAQRRLIDATIAEMGGLRLDRERG
jgi:F-type H+-transporting ATPase subunit b